MDDEFIKPDEELEEEDILDGEAASLDKLKDAELAEDEEVDTFEDEEEDEESPVDVDEEESY